MFSALLHILVSKPFEFGFESQHVLVYGYIKIPLTHFLLSHILFFKQYFVNVYHICKYPLA
jgi:hypothetical protein